MTDATSHGQSAATALAGNDYHRFRVAGNSRSRWVAPLTMAHFLGWFLGPMAGAVALTLWWLFASRVPWTDRWLCSCVFVAAAGTVWRFGDPSIAWFGLVIYALPIATTAWVLWLVSTPFLQWRDPRCPEKARGRKVTAPTLNIDFAPTLLDYADVKIPATMQGRSLRPFVGGEDPAWREDWFYEHHTLPKILPPSEAVRTNRWKYIRWVGVEPAVEELYDLQAGPLEEHNRAGKAEHKQRLETLRARWTKLRKELE